jgi:hypothetical protein
MKVHVHCLKAALAALAVTVLLGPGSAAAATQCSLVNRGWRIVEEEGGRSLELRALVVNRGPSALEYEVRFLLESRGAAERPMSPRKGKPGGVESRWSVVHAVSVRGGRLLGGASSLVKGRIPYELLKPGREYRYRAELLDVSDGAALAAVVITGMQAALGPLAAVAGGAAVASQLFSRGAGAASISGSGTMEGQHEAQRVNGEWVEHGWGTITIAGPQGSLVLDYTYESRGPSAATLRATATGTGTLVRPEEEGAPLPVEINSASAEMTLPGAREQTGEVIRRTGCWATGTFAGTVGERVCQGLLTMTQGEMTLDLSTNTGTHSFAIQFTGS